MKPSSKVTFSDEKVKKAFLELSKSNEKKIYDWLIRVFNDIENNAFCGIQIPKRQYLLYNCCGSKRC